MFEGYFLCLHSAKGQNVVLKYFCIIKKLSSIIMFIVNVMFDTC